MCKSVLRQALLVLALVLVSAASAWADGLTPKQDEKKGKWGIVDNTGKWVLKPEYTAIEPFDDGYYLMQKDDKWGLIQPSGKKALDCKYKHEMISAVGYILAQEAEKPDKWQAWDKLADLGNKTSLKNVSIKQVNDTIQIISGEIGSSYISIENSKKYIQSIVDLRRNGGQFSFLTTKGGIAIIGVSNVKHLVGDIYACSHRRGCDIYDLSTGKYIASVNSSTLSQLPTDSTLLVFPIDHYNFKYLSNTGKIYKDTLNLFDGKENRLIADGKGKYGLVDKTGKNIIIPVEYDAITKDDDTRIENGRLSNNEIYYLRKDSLWGICASSVNNSLRMLTECIYPYRVEDGQKRVPFKYLIYQVNQPFYAFFVVMSNGKAGILDNFGKEIVPCKYDGGGFSNDNSRLGYLYDNGKTITYNPKDKSTTVRKYAGYKHFLSGYFNADYYLVEQDGKYGVVDNKDNLVLPFKYSKITEARTSDNGRLDDGFHVWDLNQHIGVVKVINGKGKEVVPCGKYNSIWGYEPYGIIVMKNGKQGCIREDGTVFCDAVYDSHIHSRKRIAFIKNSPISNDGTAYIYDYNGKLLTTTEVSNQRWDITWFVNKYLM